MNNETAWIAGSCIISVVCALAQMIAFLLIVPILRRLDRHEERIGSLEIVQAGTEGDVLKQFVTKEEFYRVDEKRDRQLALQNEILDKQTRQLTRIETKCGDRGCGS